MFPFFFFAISPLSALFTAHPILAISSAEVSELSASPDAPCLSVICRTASPFITILYPVKSIERCNSFSITLLTILACDALTSEITNLRLAAISLRFICSTLSTNASNSFALLPFLFAEASLVAVSAFLPLLNSENASNIFLKFL